MTSYFTADASIAICPILLKPIKEKAYLVPCNHLVDKVAAEKKFGMIRPDGIASQPNVCPVCPTLVTGYLACANSSQLVDTSMPKEIIAQSVNEVKDTSVNKSETKTCDQPENPDLLKPTSPQATQEMFDAFNNSDPVNKWQAAFDAFNNSGPVPNPWSNRDKVVKDASVNKSGPVNDWQAKIDAFNNSGPVPNPWSNREKEVKDASVNNPGPSLNPLQAAFDQFNNSGPVPNPWNNSSPVNKWQAAYAQFNGWK